MTIALAIAIPVCVVFALGVHVGNRLSRPRRQKIYDNAYDQGKFDSYMDSLHADEEREAYEAVRDAPRDAETPF